MTPLVLESLGDLEIMDETHFTWEIKNYSKLPSKVHSPEFSCAGWNWYRTPISKYSLCALLISHPLFQRERVLTGCAGESSYSPGETTKKNASPPTSKSSHPPRPPKQKKTGPSAPNSQSSCGIPPTQQNTATQPPSIAFTMAKPIGDSPNFSPCGPPSYVRRIIMRRLSQEVATRRILRFI